MTLASVLYPSPTESGWEEWSFANYEHHLAIEEGLLQVLGIVATPFRIWPVNGAQFRDWQEQHQQSHTLFNRALGITGRDLTDLDFTDRSKADAWYFEHFIQHQAAAKTLGLSIL